MSTARASAVGGSFDPPSADRSLRALPRPPDAAIDTFLSGLREQLSAPCGIRIDELTQEDMKRLDINTGDVYRVLHDDLSVENFKAHEISSKHTEVWKFQPAFRGALYWVCLTLFPTYTLLSFHPVHTTHGEPE